MVADFSCFVAGAFVQNHYFFGMHSNQSLRLCLSSSWVIIKTVTLLALNGPIIYRSNASSDFSYLVWCSALGAFFMKLSNGTNHPQPSLSDTEYQFANSLSSEIISILRLQFTFFSDTLFGMKLSILKKRDLKEIAEKAGTTVDYLNQIRLGHRHPSRKLALKIEKVTQGAITKEELLFPEMN